MGYRSQVVIAVDKECFKQHKKELLITSGSLNGQYAFEDCTTIEEHLEFYIFTYDWVKWYDSYEDVKCWVKFINSHPDHTAMLRIGEESGDTESYGDLSDYGIELVVTAAYPRNTEVPWEDLVKNNAQIFIEEIKEDP